MLVFVCEHITYKGVLMLHSLFSFSQLVKRLKTHVHIPFVMKTGFQATVKKEYLFFFNEVMLSCVGFVCKFQKWPIFLKRIFNFDILNIF